MLVGLWPVRAANYGQWWLQSNRQLTHRPSLIYCEMTKDNNIIIYNILTAGAVLLPLHLPEQCCGLSFLSARRYASAGNSDRNVSVCLSVCLSCADIVSKRRKLASWFHHHLVAPWFSCSDAKFHHQILRGSPRMGASKKGRSEKFSDFLALSVNVSKTVADTAKVTISH